MRTDYVTRDSFAKGTNPPRTKKYFRSTKSKI